MRSIPGIALLVLVLAAGCSGKGSVKPGGAQTEPSSAGTATAAITAPPSAGTASAAAAPAPCCTNAGPSEPGSGRTSPGPAEPSLVPSSGGAAQGQPCPEGRCAPGLSCVRYYGIAGPRGPAFTSCEIPCSGPRAKCPRGQQCLAIADGPGQVCRPLEGPVDSPPADVPRAPAGELR